MERIIIGLMLISVILLGCAKEIPCLNDWNGYLFEEGICKFSNQKSCEDPFDYHSQEECEVANNISKCDEYTYSTCPADCEKRCVSSSCDGDICTDDCDGEGSCRSA